MSGEPEGRMTLVLRIDVSTAEMRDWDSERITRFFDGLARAIAAVNGDPREETDEVVRAHLEVLT